jgi:hypothetical protein
MQGRIKFDNGKKAKTNNKDKNTRDEDEIEIGGLKITSDTQKTTTTKKNVVGGWGEAQEVPSLIGTTKNDKPAPNIPKSKNSKFTNSKIKRSNWNDTSKTLMQGKEPEAVKPLEKWNNDSSSTGRNQWNNPPKIEPKKFVQTKKISLMNAEENEKEEEAKKERLRKKMEALDKLEEQEKKEQENKLKEKPKVNPNLSKIAEKWNKFSKPQTTVPKPVEKKQPVSQKTDNKKKSFTNSKKQTSKKTVNKTKAETKPVKNIKIADPKAKAKELNLPKW